MQQKETVEYWKGIARQAFERIEQQKKTIEQLKKAINNLERACLFYIHRLMNEGKDL